MSPELIGILAVGVALAGLTFRLIQSLRNDVRADIGRLDARVTEQGTRLARIETKHGERLARIEGLLEGLGLRRGDSLAPGD